MYGDDEKGCTDLVCPGFLKCRGEMRCVGNDENDVNVRDICSRVLRPKHIHILYAKGLELPQTAFEIHLLYLQYIL